VNKLYPLGVVEIKTLPTA